MHHILNGGLPKIVTANFHGQAIHSHQSRVMGEYLMCDKVLSGIIRRNDGCNDIIGRILIIGQQLTGILRKAVAPITEGRIVIVRTDAGIEPYSSNDLLGIQAVQFGVCIQLIEKGYTQSEIGIGEKFDGFSFGRVHHKRGDLLIHRPFLKKRCETFRPLAQFRRTVLRGTHDDAGRVKIIVESSPLTQELRGKKNIRNPIQRHHGGKITYRNR